jgi:hypothetical protein
MTDPLSYIVGWRYSLVGRRQNGSTPFCNPHQKLLHRQGKMVSDFRKKLLFEKWVNKTSAAKALYWRLHPDEIWW